jgi:hypothetical protein
LTVQLYYELCSLSDIYPHMEDRQVPFVVRLGGFDLAILRATAICDLLKQKSLSRVRGFVPGLSLSDMVVLD